LAEQLAALAIDRVDGTVEAGGPVVPVHSPEEQILE